MATIKTTGGDYANIPAWEAAIAANDSTGTCDESANLCGAYIEINAPYTGLLLTASASHAVTAPTYAHATSKARIEFGYRAALIYNTEITIEKIGIVMTSAAAGDDLVSIDISTGNTTVTFRRCVFVGIGATNKNSVVNRGSGATTYIQNCAAFNFGNAGFTTVAGTMTCHHVSTHQSAGQGFYEYAGTLNCYACISMGGATNYSGTIGGDENVSQDTTAPGTTYWRSQTGVFANTSAGFEDLSLSAGAQGDYGVSDYSGTHGDLATDISGTTRTGTIDAGVWQTPAAAATSFVPRTRPAHFVHLRR